MKTIQVFDPALCCSTGVCGADVDQALVSFSADAAWAKLNGAQIERFNLAQQPMAFAENGTVKGLSGTLGRGSVAAGSRQWRSRLGGPLPQPCGAGTLGRHFADCHRNKACR